MMHPASAVPSYEPHGLGKYLSMYVEVVGLPALLPVLHLLLHPKGKVA